MTHPCQLEAVEQQQQRRRHQCHERRQQQRHQQQLLIKDGERFNSWLEMQSSV